MASADGFVAAIAASNGSIVATRDVAPFEAAGLRVIDSWFRRRRVGGRHVTGAENDNAPCKSAR